MQTEAVSNYELTLQRNLFRHRVLWGIVLVFFAMALLFGRVAYLQVIEFTKYDFLSNQNRLQVEPIAPLRGHIFDRNGKVLATNQQMFVLKVVPERIEDAAQTWLELHRLLPRHFEAQNQADVLQRFTQRRRAFQSSIVAKGLSHKEAARFAANQYRFAGITLSSETLRVYPYGASTAHIVGYVGAISNEEAETLEEVAYRGVDQIGKLGLEQSYESMLKGDPGLITHEVNAAGRPVRTIDTLPPQAGQNLLLSLDIDLQRLGEALLGDRRGAIVAIDPTSGGVLAMVSMPSYDPNRFVTGISQSVYNRYLNDPQKPFLNRTIAGQYPPGSTVKQFMGLVGLERGFITKDTTIDDPGYFIYKERRYRDWKRGGHGVVNVVDALRSSCDTFFYQLALDMTIDTISSGLSPFGFGEKTHIDVLHEKSGILPSREWKHQRMQKDWYPGETIITGIGQGFFLTTPMQLAKATAILANRGQAVTPRLVQKSTSKLTEQIPIRQRENWETVIEGMVQVMHHKKGTANKAGQHLPFVMAGKTGTAQVFGLEAEEEYDESKIPVHLRDHALFVGFAPVHQPKIAIAVVVENGGAGSKAAAPIGVQMVEKYLQDLQEIHHDNHHALTDRTTIESS